ncbi:hypothetical protein GALMADRAFT_817513 [Galerina marginata CBS 339.88]|uniref:Uncharacterized protein n=1 Tax=Galerina marginata (strain CBS 339.88) TaxID=685588 RepID=A0A067TGJ0_GALM3|nr:hypothetical protein GALMADRAFT_817513 [Galerina marginata CBS 339.88]
MESGTLVIASQSFYCYYQGHRNRTIGFLHEPLKDTQSKLSNASMFRENHYFVRKSFYAT